MQKLGRYEIVGELGRGGCGVVYRATDPKIGRQVAIKTIVASSEDDPTATSDLLIRLRREAQSAGALSHPNIVTVHELAEEGDITYIVMEHVTGQKPAPDYGGRTIAGPDRLDDAQAGRRCPRLRSFPGRGASGCQAGQLSAHRPWRREGNRLRHRQVAERRKHRRHPDRHDDRHHLLHGSRADRHDPGGRADRSVLPRRDGLRDAHRAAPVSGRFLRQHHSPGAQPRPTCRWRNIARRSDPAPLSCCAAHWPRNPRNATPPVRISCAISKLPCSPQVEPMPRSPRPPPSPRPAYMRRRQPGSRPSKPPPFRLLHPSPRSTARKDRSASWSGCWPRWLPRQSRC